MPETPSAERRPVLLLIDGHSMVYRAYYALAPQMALNLRSTGEPIGAVFNFANMLLRAVNDVRPDYWAIALDSAGPTFRDQLHAEYKAGRAETPDELSSQWRRVRQLLEAFDIPTIELQGFEADDLVGTLSRMAAERGIGTVIMTGDTDEMQLVGPHAKVRLTTGQADTKLYDETLVKERYGVTPAQIVDYKAIKGDTSDNIAGIPGVGEKTASALLQQYGSIDAILQRVDEVVVPRQPRIRELLKEHAERLRQNQKLLAIVRDVPLEFDFEQARTDALDRTKAVKALQELEFQSLLNRLPGNGAPAAGAPSPAAPASARSYTPVTDEQTLAALVDALKGAGQFALDAIATSERSMEADLVGLGFATEPNKAWYVPIGHRLGTQLPADLVLQHLKPVLEDPGIRKLAHNGKFDMTVLANRGITLRGLEADVTIAAYLLGAKALSIKGQAFEKLAEQLPAPSEVIGSGAKAVTFAQAIIEQTAPLSCAQADTALRLWPVYRPLLERDRLLGIFNDIEMPLLPVLERMERTGIAIDVPLLKRMSREMDTQVQQAEAAAYEVVGHEFKINSPKELSNLLFEELNLPKPRKTKTGYSTDAQVLEALRTNPDTSPKGALVIDKVLEYRQVTKLKSTYVDALPTLVNPRTGRVHTTLSQTVAATGRLSSSDPNLQNIPVRTEMGKRIREAFIVQDPGWRMLSADYSQIELRILAHITKDPGLVEAFQRDEDIHASTAARVFDVPIGQVTADQRRFAKVVNFGLLYGMSEFGLATRADMAREKAAPIIEEYFKKYPGIQKYLDDTKKLAREQGYVETLLGRRRYIPEVQAANPQVRAAGERMAINHPAQGTAADIIKIGMIRLQAEMDRMALRARMLLQVHDELIFEAPKDEMDALKGLVKKIMPAAMELIVPLKVDLKEGQTWGEME